MPHGSARMKPAASWAYIRDNPGSLTRQRRAWSTSVDSGPSASANGAAMRAIARATQNPSVTSRRDGVQGGRPRPGSIEAERVAVTA